MMKLTFVNVGYGEAILVECPDPASPNGVFTMIVDGGSGEAEEYEDRASGRLTLTEYLSSVGWDHTNLCVNTHVHEDHICGLLPVAEKWKPGALWQTLPVDFRSTMPVMDGSLAKNTSQRKFMQALNDYRTLWDLMGDRPILQITEGASGQLCEGLSYTVLAPSAAGVEAMTGALREVCSEAETDVFLQKLSALDGKMNNYSLILMLDYQGTRILLPGDTNRSGYGTIDPGVLPAHIFKVGHHGQIDGADRALLDAVKPEAVICCASSDRRYNSAHPELMQTIAENSRLYFSDCPPVPGMEILPHRALTFTIGPNGQWEAEYRS